MFKVFPGAFLRLRRTGITGGVAADGGGILTAGTLELDTSRVVGNRASGAGGDIAVWGGETRVLASTIWGNTASGNGGGGLFVCNQATLEVYGSTLAHNVALNGGGGLFSSYGGQIHVTNSTLSGNDSGAAPGGAVSVVPSNNGQNFDSSLSADGQFVAFCSDASNLVPGDTNGTTDIFVYDRQEQTVQRVSVASDGTQGNATSP